MKNKFKILGFAALMLMINACGKNIEIKEQSLGPFFTVCSESFKNYDFNPQIIDSLKSELESINLKPQQTFEIIYNRETEAKRHSIVGCILPTDVKNDSLAIIALERNRFNIREIGFTDCITVEVEKQEFNNRTRGEVIELFDQYANQHNFQLFPDGKNGLTQINFDDKIIFAVEIKSK